MSLAGWGGGPPGSVPQAGIPPRGPDLEDEDDADLLEAEEDMDWDQAQVRLSDFFPSLIGARASRLTSTEGEGEGAHIDRATCLD